MSTKIEWVKNSDGTKGETWNPVTGCTRASAGCDHCYAVAMTRRLAAMGQPRYQGLLGIGKGHFNGVVKCHPDVLEKPQHWKKPRMIFVNSMSDLFHPSVPDWFVGNVFETIHWCPQHIFQILTKRPERVPHVLGPDGCGVYAAEGPVPCPLPNVWLGTSVENQATADERIPHLLRCPAAVRFLSCEPLLGALDGLDKYLRCPICCYTPRDVSEQMDHRLCSGPGPGIHWVIVGGESGPGARPMHPDWARSIRDQCIAAGVPFFFKQWGEWLPIDQPWIQKSPAPLAPNERWLNLAGGHGFHGEEVWRMRRVGKKKAGRLLDGREWNEMPNQTLTANR